MLAIDKTIWDENKNHCDQDTIVMTTVDENYKTVWLGTAGFDQQSFVIRRLHSAESGVGNAYLQGKYSLGGCSEFSAGSQFFLGLIFYRKILGT